MGKGKRGVLRNAVGKEGERKRLRLGVLIQSSNFRCGKRWSSSFFARLNCLFEAFFLKKSYTKHF